MAADHQEKTLTNDRQDRAARAEQMRKERGRADKRSRNLITIAIVVVVVALIVGTSVAISKSKKDNQVATMLSTPQFVNKDYGIDYTTEAVTGTAAKDPVKVILYEDFQCPTCKAFESVNGPFLKRAVAAGDISLEWRTISFLDSSRTDDYSSRAFNAALCVLDSTDVRTYENMHEILFSEQSPESGPGLTDATLNDLAKQAGASSQTSCTKTKKYGPWITNATAASKKVGVTGTPTVIINNKQVAGKNGIPTPADLQKAIQAAKS